MMMMMMMIMMMIICSLQPDRKEFYQVHQPHRNVCSSVDGM